jgi:predicted nucleotidyltransferase
MIAALFPSTKRKVLALFLLNADRQYYFTEVVRLTRTRQGAVQRELKKLSDAGILTFEQRGRQKYYAANKANPIFPDLRNIVFKTFGVIGRIKEALVPLAENIRVAFIYGSFAKGQETAGSDIDLFVIGRVSLEEIVSALADVESAVGREINPSLYTEAAFRNKLRQRNHFAVSVMKSEKEFVVGTDNELRELAAE